MLDSKPHSNGPTMHFLRRILLLLSVLLALAACGKKGQLYLPDAPVKPLPTQSQQ